MWYTENNHSSIFYSDSGSSSSGSGSGGRSGSEKSSIGNRSHHSDDTKSPKHSNANSSKSDHHTDKDSSDDEGPKPRSRSSHGRVKSDLWEENPDIYGIRRSARSRKEPDRLRLAADSDSSERGDRGRAHHRRNRKKR